MNDLKLKQLDKTTIQLIDGDRGVNYPNKNDFRENGFCLFLDSSNLTPNGFDFSSKVFITSEKDKAMGNGKLQRGDIVINTRGTIGNIGHYTKEIPFDNIRINSGMLIIRGGSDYDDEFLYCFLRSKLFLSQVDKIMSGSVQNQLPIWTLNSAKILELDTTSQKKIATVISAIDKKIDNNNQINVELETMAKTIYDYWFVQFDFPDSEGKPYKSSGGKMVWNNELKREIPDGWSVRTLLDIAKYINGLPCQKFRPINNDFLRVIKIKEMHEGFSTETEFVRSDIPKEFIVKNGDVLFSWSASLDVQIWSKGKGALNQHIFKVTSEKYPKSFYFFQLLNYLEHFKMMAANRKTTMGHITQEHLEQSRIVVPPDNFIDLLLKCENILSQIFEEKIKCEMENQQLSELRDFLLPMLMNGQITVQ